MPYKIVHMDGGFAVRDAKGKEFSKRPLTKKIATKQRIAIALSESQKTGKPVSAFFA
jgi:hypothetical protein